MARAIDIYIDRFGGGDIKLFGGEPLLEPEVVREVFRLVARRDEIRWVYLSTNGLGLDSDWLDMLSAYPKGILTLSLDGTAEQNRRFRRPQKKGVGDAYDHIRSLLPQLLKTPRVVVTQTIAPAAAAHAAENFEHLLSLGFWRFNLLPGYYLPWKPQQLQTLHQNFDAMAERMEQRWNADQPMYLRNLFTWAPTPFFNTGMIVDSDRTIHPSNVGLSGQLSGLRGRTQVGCLDDPPTAQELAERARDIEGLLQQSLSEHVWSSTRAVDAALSALCQRLYPTYVAYRKRRSAA